MRHPLAYGQGISKEESMPRRLRHSLQENAFHVMNRAVRRTTLFSLHAGLPGLLALCRHFESFKVKVIAYCLCRTTGISFVWRSY